MSSENQDGAVWIVEDNDDVRGALSRSVQQAGIEVFAYGKPNDFLQDFDDKTPGCLLIDFYLPDIDGHQLYEQLLRDGCSKPVIFISGQADLTDAVSLMRMGAIDFVQKPFDVPAIVKIVEAAISADQRRQKINREAKETGQRVKSLSVREREVLDLVVEGLATKNIARRLDISPKTVEVHRSNITRKMKADSVPHLVRMVMNYKLRSDM